jgi:phage terminase large subunit GpA-like protein
VGLIVTYLIKALAGNGSVHIPQHAAIWRKLCFLCGLRQANKWNSRTSVARQQSCKHASLTIENDVFHGIHAEELSWRQSMLQVQFSVGDSHGMFTIEERLNTWSEYVMCAVVQWYLGYDSYSLCVKICCQKMDRENFATTSVNRYRMLYLSVIITLILKAL